MKDIFKKIAGNIYIYIQPQAVQRFLNVRNFLLALLGEEVQVCNSRLVPRDEIG